MNWYKKISTSSLLCLFFSLCYFFRSTNSFSCRFVFHWLGYRTNVGNGDSECELFCFASFFCVIFSFYSTNLFFLVGPCFVGLGTGTSVGNGDSEYELVRKDKYQFFALSIFFLVIFFVLLSFFFL